MLRAGVPFDVVALQQDVPPLALAVRASKIKGNEKWSSTTHTYVRLKKLKAVNEWPAQQFVRCDPYIVYVMEATRPEGPPLFHFDGKDYQIVAVPPDRYLAHAAPRAAGSWDKVQVSSSVFESIAIPLDALLRRHQCGAPDSCYSERRHAASLGTPATCCVNLGNLRPSTHAC